MSKDVCGPKDADEYRISMRGNEVLRFKKGEVPEALLNLLFALGKEREAQRDYHQALYCLNMRPITDEQFVALKARYDTLSLEVERLKLLYPSRAPGQAGLPRQGFGDGVPDNASSEAGAGVGVAQTPGDPSGKESK
jgi:hypothetical protein